MVELDTSSKNTLKTLILLFGDRPFKLNDIRNALPSEYKHIMNDLHMLVRYFYVVEYPENSWHWKVVKYE